jgi:hypothetical protein
VRETCSTHAEDEKCMHNFSRNTSSEGNLGEQGVDEDDNIKMNFK